MKALHMGGIADNPSDVPDAPSPARAPTRSQPSTAAPFSPWRRRLSQPARLVLVALRLPETLATWIASFAIVAITLLTFLNAVARYIFNQPLHYALETAALLFVYTVYLAVASAARAGMHTRITWLHDIAPGVVRRILGAATSLVGIFFAFVLFWSGLTYSGQSIDRGFETNELLLDATAPLYAFHAAVAAGGLLLLIYHISELALALLGREDGRTGSSDEAQPPAWTERL